MWSVSAWVLTVYGDLGRQRRWAGAAHSAVVRTAAGRPTSPFLSFTKQRRTKNENRLLLENRFSSPRLFRRSSLVASCFAVSFSFIFKRFKDAQSTWFHSAAAAAAADCHDDHSPAIRILKKAQQFSLCCAELQQSAAALTRRKDEKKKSRESLRGK